VPPHLPLLLVEDDAGFREAFARMLRFAGYEVVTAENGHNLPEQSPHFLCLILDIQIGEEDAFQLLARLRRAECEAPVIFITGHDSPSHRAAARANDAVAYLTKPFPRDAILSPLEQIASQAEAGPT